MKISSPSKPVSSGVRARAALTQNSIFRCIFQASPESRSNNIFPRGRAEFVTLPFPRPEVRRYKLRKHLGNNRLRRCKRGEGGESALFRPSLRMESLSILGAPRVPFVLSSKLLDSRRWEKICENEAGGESKLFTIVGTKNQPSCRPGGVT